MTILHPGTEHIPCFNVKQPIAQLVVDSRLRHIPKLDMIAPTPSMGLHAHYFCDSEILRWGKQLGYGRLAFGAVLALVDVEECIPARHMQVLTDQERRIISRAMLTSRSQYYLWRVRVVNVFTQPCWSLFHHNGIWHWNGNTRKVTNWQMTGDSYQMQLGI